MKIAWCELRPSIVEPSTSVPTGNVMPHQPGLNGMRLVKPRTVMARAQATSGTPIVSMT